MAKHVMVLGAGPAGLAAAHAAYRAGASVTIVSAPPTSQADFRNEYNSIAKSRLYGCQYLHAALPELDLEKRIVKYQLIGTPEQYREKVYGNAWHGQVSPEDLIGEHAAWDIRAAYAQLWDLYIGNRKRANSYPAMITPQWLANNFWDFEQIFDVIISTIPMPNICKLPDVHTFYSHNIWAVGDAPETGQISPVTAPDETIMCSGEKYPSWYRVSRVFGMTTAEWPELTKPPIPYVRSIRKPLYTDCDCWGDSIVRAGRYGAWNKPELVHHVFYKTEIMLQEMQENLT